MNSTATGQMVRGESPVQSGYWAKMFPAKIESDVNSSTFLKELITVALSNITYIRSMFPEEEEAYANRSLDGLSLKILREKSNCKEAKTLASWLLGAFDALEKKYLRELMLNVYLDKSNPNAVHEMYNFKLSYPGGKTTCQVLQGMKEVQNVNSDDIDKSTKNLLRTLVVLTRGLDPLPGSAFLEMKLAYYDDITPEDYEPAGFKATDLTDQELSEGSKQIEVKELSTGHHSLKLRVHITPRQFEETNMEHPTKSYIDPNHNLELRPLSEQGDKKNTHQHEDTISNLPLSQPSIIKSSQTKVVPDASSTSDIPASSVSLLQDSQPQVQHPVPSFDQNSQSNVIITMAGQIISEWSTENCVQESGGGWYSAVDSIVEKKEEMIIENKENKDLNIGNDGVPCKRSLDDVQDNTRSKRMKGSRSKDNLSV